MEKFEKLGLSKNILKVLHEKGFTEPSEIQEKTIPLVLAGKDIIGGSATGSGKTLAFSSSIIENLKQNSHVQALILTPTRELAEQVSNSIREFAKNDNLRVLAIYGGVDIQLQMRKLSSTDVVVGTPGRILDHMARGTLKLNEIKFLVLDEVDRMFDMGFHVDVEKIISKCPEKRQTMLFSATISENMSHLAKKYTKNAVEVSIDSHIDPSQLEQVYYDVENRLKFSLLVHLLKEEKSELAMIFCSTRRNADFVTSNLNKFGINAKAIHGGLSQNQRLSVLKAFHGRSINVLVCTDVAARGLDIKDVSHIYNYDLPKTSEEYIHRIGRTARAGKEGKAINLLSDRDYDNFSSILRDELLKITPEELPKFEVLRIDMEKRRDFGSNRDSFRRNFSRGRSERSYGGNTHKTNTRNPRGNSIPRRDDSRKGEDGKWNYGNTHSSNGSRSYSSRNRTSSGNRYSSRKPNRNSGRNNNRGSNRYGRR